MAYFHDLRSPLADILQPQDMKELCSLLVMVSSEATKTLTGIYHYIQIFLLLGSLHKFGFNFSQIYCWNGYNFSIFFRKKNNNFSITKSVLEWFGF